MTEPLEASVTLDEVFVVVSAKRVPLAPELAGYLALEIAEGASKQPGEVDPRNVYISEEGSVALVRSREAKGEAEASIRALLARLLVATGSQTPALGAVARKKATGELGSLVEELEAALIPVNRAAGRRALARMAREVKRVTLRVGRNASVPAASELAPRASERPPPQHVEPARSERPPPSAATFDAEEVPTTARRDIPPEVLEGPPQETPGLQQPPSLSDMPTVGLSKEDLMAAAARGKRDSVDSLLDSFEVSGQREDKALSGELKAMVGLEPTPPPPRTDDDIEALLGASAPVKAAAPAKSALSAQAGARNDSRPERPARGPSSSRADDRQLPTAPSLKRSQLSITTELRRRRSGRDRALLIMLILLVGVLAVTLWMLKPGFFTGRTPDKVAAERAAALAASAKLAAKRAEPQCHASLVVGDAPEDAEILLRAGQAPIDIDRMPAGARLEFVATAEGYAPKRAVVPADAAWDHTGPGGKPRFELAIQLDKSKARHGAVDKWPPGEPGSEVGGKGDPGVVHVVASPKGAEVWVLAGLGPSAQIDDLIDCDHDADVLVAGPGTYRKRLHVAGSSFVAEPGAPAGVRTARVSAK